MNSGAYRIINGTCSHTASAGLTLSEMGKCPVLRDIDIQCYYNTAGAVSGRNTVVLFTFVMIRSIIHNFTRPF